MLAAGLATLAVDMRLLSTVLIFTICWVLFRLSDTLHFLSDHAPTLLEERLQPQGYDAFLQVHTGSEWTVTVPAPLTTKRSK